MENLFYIGMAFQILVGLWLFISPFASGFWEAHLTFNNMVLGVIVCLLGIGSLFYEIYRKEEFKSKDTSPEIERSKKRT